MVSLIIEVRGGIGPQSWVNRSIHGMYLYQGLGGLEVDISLHGIPYHKRCRGAIGQASG